MRISTSDQLLFLCSNVWPSRVSWREYHADVDVTDVGVKTSFMRHWGAPFHRSSSFLATGIQVCDLQRFPYSKPKQSTVSYGKIPCGHRLCASKDQFHEALTALFFQQPEDQDLNAVFTAGSVLENLAKHGKLQQNVDVDTADIDVKTNFITRLGS